MNARFNRKNVLAEIDARLNGAVYRYEERAGKKYDFGNGYAQVPKGNHLAYMAYGEIEALKYLLDELQ